MIILLIPIIIMWSFVGLIRFFNNIDVLPEDNKELLRFYAVGGPACWIIGSGHLLYRWMESVSPV